MTGTWPLGWATGDVTLASEFKKGIGSISDTLLVGSAANVDITGIVATYAHLLLVVYARGDNASLSLALNLRFNGDSAANYDTQRLLGSAATASGVESFAGGGATMGFVTGSTAAANLFNAAVLFIPHYAGSSNNKVAFAASATKTGTTTGTMSSYLMAGFWRSNAAINRITLLPGLGNFVAGTRVTLYGMGA